MWITHVWTKPLASWTLLDILGALVFVPITLWFGWTVLLGLGSLVFILPGHLHDQWQKQTRTKKVKIAAMTLLWIFGIAALAVAALREAGV